MFTYGQAVCKAELCAQRPSQGPKQGEMSPTPLDHRIKTSFVVQAFSYLHSVTPCFVFHGAHVHVLAMPAWHWLAAATALTAPGVDASHTTFGNLLNLYTMVHRSALVSVAQSPAVSHHSLLTCATDPAMACLLRLSQDCVGGSGTAQTAPAVCQHRQHDLAMPALPSVSFCRSAEPELNLSAERRVVNGSRTALHWNYSHTSGIK